MWHRWPTDGVVLEITHSSPLFLMLLFTLNIHAGQYFIPAIDYLRQQCNPVLCRHDSEMAGLSQKVKLALTHH